MPGNPDGELAPIAPVDAHLVRDVACADRAEGDAVLVRANPRSVGERDVGTTSEHEMLAPDDPG
jgi:hypothetical protein